MSALDLLSVSGNWVWPQGRTPLLVTNHGSHLYGTAQVSSDRDIYCVLTKRTVKWKAPFSPTHRATWSTQRVENGVDITMLDLGTWINQCIRGVPQALEAMFAPDPEVDVLAAMRAGWRVGSTVWPSYLRTIKSFAMTESDDPAAVKKRQVHALRLAWNLHQMRDTGRFDPVLHPMQVDQYRRVVDQMEGDREALLDLCLRVAWK